CCHHICARLRERNSGYERDDHEAITIDSVLAFRRLEIPPPLAEAGAGAHQKYEASASVESATSRAATEKGCEFNGRHADCDGARDDWHRCRERADCGAPLVASDRDRDRGRSSTTIDRQRAAREGGCDTGLRPDEGRAGQSVDG